MEFSIPSKFGLGTYGWHFNGTSNTQKGNENKPMLWP